MGDEKVHTSFDTSSIRADILAREIPLQPYALIPEGPTGSKYGNVDLRPVHGANTSERDTKRELKPLQHSSYLCKRELGAKRCKIL